MIRLEFTPELADLEEAIKPAAPAAGKKRVKTVGKGALVGWVAFVGMAVIFVLFSKRVPTPLTPRPPAFQPMQGPQDLLVTLLPSLVPASFLFAILMMIVFQQRHMGRVDPQKAGKRAAAAAKFMAYLLVAGIFVVVGAFMLPAHQISWTPTRQTQLAVGFAPWVAVLMATTLLFRPGRAARATWNLRASARSPRVLEIDENGVTVTTELFTCRYAWRFFATFRETPGVFVLMTADGEQVLIPKRVIGDDQKTHELRGLLKTGIPTGETAPPEARFPVVTARA